MRAHLARYFRGASPERLKELTDLRRIDVAERLLVRRSQTLGDEVRNTTKQRVRYALELPEEVLAVLCWHVDTQLETEGKRYLTDSGLVFRSGVEIPVVDVDGVRVSVNVCYDLQFDEGALAAARAGAQVLACPCNNMIRRESAERWKQRHNEIRSARAREARLWLVSSDVTGERGGRISYGPTAVIDPQGRVLTQIPLLTEGIALWNVDWGGRGTRSSERERRARVSMRLARLAS